MCFCKNNKRIFLSMICLVMSISFTACAKQTGGEDAQVSVAGSQETQYSVVTREKEGDISIPEEITMEFFGINLLEINRPMWEKHIYSIYDVGKDDDMGTRIPIGDYEVMHDYLNLENMRNFSVSISYDNNFSGSQILFDENGKLTKIDVTTDMGEEFNTSFLKIGDNVKDYFETSKKGIWDKILSGEIIAANDGWNIRHSAFSAPEVTYDNLQVFNKDLFVSYVIKDEKVNYILVNVIGDLNIDENLLAEKSIYNLDRFKFYIKDKDISRMSGSDWANAFGKSFEEMLRELFVFSGNNSKYGNYGKSGETVVGGLRMKWEYKAYEDYNWMHIGTESVSKLKKTNLQITKVHFPLLLCLGKMEHTIFPCILPVKIH